MQLVNEELEKKGPKEVEKKLPDPNRPEDVEPLRDEIERAVMHGRRLQKLLAGKLSRENYSMQDLGLFAEGEVAQMQTRDKGLGGDDIQRIIDKVQHSTTYESKKDTEAKLFVVKMLSKGFLGYLRLRKLLGMPKESFSISQWNRMALEQALPLINPGGLVWIREGAYPIAIMLDHKAGVAIKGAGIPSTSIVATTNAMTMLKHEKSIGNILRDIEFDADLKAARVIDWVNATAGQIRVKIIDLTTNSQGVRLYIDDYNWGCYLNDIWVTDLRNNPSCPTGSIGILLDTGVGAPNFCEPNTNVLRGYIKQCAVGVHYKWGKLIKNFGLAAELNDTAFLIESGLQTFISCHDEGNITDGIKLTRTAAAGAFPEKYGNAIWIGGYYEKLNLTHTSCKIIFRNFDGDQLCSKATTDTPFIKFSVAGSHTLKLLADGSYEVIKMLDDGGRKRVELGGTLGDTGKGSVNVFWGPAGTEEELWGVKVGSAGNRAYFKWWDHTANAYKYVYIDNGAWVISASLPT